MEPLQSIVVAAQIRLQGMIHSLYNIGKNTSKLHGGICRLPIIIDGANINLHTDVRRRSSSASLKKHQSSMKPKVLLIEDGASTRFGFGRYLSSSGYEVIEARDLSSANRMLALHQCAAALIDINLPDGSGLDLIEKIRNTSRTMSIFIITGEGDIPLAVQAMHKGADNFLTKPVDMEELELFLKDSMEKDDIATRQALRHSSQESKEIWSGSSVNMIEVVNLARIAAENDSPVLITGETGPARA